MLWNPAFHASLAAKPVITSSLPSLGSPVHGFDTSDITKFWTDTAGTAAAANGSLIARANDAFGGSYFFRQQTLGERPTLVTNAVNGKAALRFNGTTSWMALQNASSGAVNSGELFRSLTFTLIAAYKRTSEYGGIFAAGSSTGGENSLALDNLTLQLKEPGNISAARHSGSEYRNAFLTSPTTVAGQVTKVILRGSPANGLDLRSKAVAGTFTGSTSLASTPDSWTWDYTTLGAELGHMWGPMPQNHLTGDIMEVRFWNSRASDAEADALMTYLDNKWGN